MTAEDRKFYMNELKGEECLACGRPKRRGRSFCYSCYSSLPKHMQKALWQPLGNGYEAAFDEALKWLGD
ncbi:MAG: hypothetical protein SWH61_05435 [Thermodesulfobacteriota bacterium]|nr:hypothetical protein [Thermodesulfobacteriota bacterium]